MRFELFVALRYLRARRKQAVISVISIISVVGVAAGVMALTIALALNNGLQREFQARILGATSHLNLLPARERAISGYQGIADALSGMPRIKSVVPTVYGQTMLQSGSRQGAAILKGIGGDPSQLSNLSVSIIEGTTAGFHDGGKPFPIILGKDLAGSLGALVGEPVRAYGLKGELSPFGRSLRIGSFRVVAVFESGLWEYDSNWALVPLAAAQSFFGLAKDQASALEMRVEDIYAVESQARTVQEALGDGFATNTWIELNRPLFAALELEKLALFVAIGLIVLVAALNIVSTLTLMVMDKNRDISIITAMGGTPRTVTVVFMLQGLIIGLAGTSLGGILGAATAWYLDAYQAIELEPRVYSIPYVPFQLNSWDLVVVSLLAVLISFAATLYPARAASGLDPLEGLRHE